VGVSAPSSSILNSYQPAGRIEEFFQALAKLKELPTREQAINKTYNVDQKIALKQGFEAHGMVLAGPPPTIE
jgi:hypothetical protein